MLLKLFPALIAEPGVQRKGAVMTATLGTVTKKKPESTAEQLVAEVLVRRAREQELSLTGPGGLLKQLTMP